MQRILVTGGLGYIGSHLVKGLLDKGHNVRVLDDFSTGKDHCNFPNVEIIRGSILDFSILRSVLDGIDIVIHLAAKKSVDESLLQPEKYFRENTEGTWILLRAMKQAKVNSIIFSSTAAVYNPEITGRIAENSPLLPATPYGQSKLMCEKLIESFCTVYDFKSVILRYFNVIGAGDSALGDTSGESLLPRVFSAISENRNPQIFGSDYNTADGTCVRDFIHVSDIVESHLVCMDYLTNNPGFNVFNVGTAIGYSVRELINQVSEVLGVSFEIDLLPRRTGDVPVSIADNKKLLDATGWKAVLTLSDMVRSAWLATNLHHNPTNQTR